MTTRTVMNPFVFVFLFASLVHASEAKQDNKDISYTKILNSERTCKEFSNMFLQFRKLGTLGDPTYLIQNSKYSNTGELPEFSLTSKLDDQITAVLDNSTTIHKPTKWTLTIESNSEVPTFEQKFLDTYRFKQGKYKRKYNFEVIKNSCVLRSIDMEFSPVEEKNKKIKSESLSKSNCTSLSKSFIKKAMKFFSNSPLIREVNLKELICNEALIFFTEPNLENKTETTPPPSINNKKSNSVNQVN